MYGADIEFLLYDSTKKRVVPIFGRVGGTKNKPIAINDTYSYLEDNACIEFNYKPNPDPFLFMQQVLETKDHIKNLVGLQIYPKPEGRIVGLGKFKQAEEFGCMPDYWAYADDPSSPRNPMPSAEDFGSWRFAGGHIHLSYENPDAIPRWVIARLMDIFVTIPILFSAYNMFGSVRAAKLIGKERKKYYGLPGLYRPKEYGIEYRTLSNYFALNPRIAERLAEQLDMFSRVIRDVVNLNEIYLNVDWGQVQTALTTMNWQLITHIAHNRIHEV